MCSEKTYRRGKACGFGGEVESSPMRAKMHTHTPIPARPAELIDSTKAIAPRTSSEAIAAAHTSRRSFSNTAPHATKPKTTGTQIGKPKIEPPVQAVTAVLTGTSLTRVVIVVHWRREPTMRSTAQIPALIADRCIWFLFRKMVSSGG